MTRLLVAMALFLPLNSFAAPIFGTEVKMTGYVSGGSGCPQGSVQVVMSPDGSEFTVLYDQLSIGVGLGKAQAVAECEVKISVTKPILMGFRVQSADFRGFIALAPGVIAEQRVSLTAGSSKKIRNATADFEVQRWYGPIQDNYTLSAVHVKSPIDILTCVPASKKSQIVIKTKIRMSQGRNPNAEGLLAVDSSDGRIEQRYHLSWTNCAEQVGGIINGLLSRGR